MFFSLNSNESLDRDLLVLDNSTIPLAGLSILCGKPINASPGLLYFFF
tara:strand:+ start:391 stop:534 length:144 start_codon:yes stop_codon:yes gene_type:complete